MWADVAQWILTWLNSSNPVVITTGTVIREVIRMTDIDNTLPTDDEGLEEVEVVEEEEIADDEDDVLGLGDDDDDLLGDWDADWDDDDDDDGKEEVEEVADEIE